jgi:hypothetical protein
MPRPLEIGVLLRLAVGRVKSRSLAGWIGARGFPRNSQNFFNLRGGGAHELFAPWIALSRSLYNASVLRVFMDGTKYRLSDPNINRRNVADRG